MTSLITEVPAPVSNRKRKMIGDEIVYQLFTAEHQDEVLYLLVEVFLPEEPLSRALGITFEALEPYRSLLSSALFWQVSHVALDKRSGKVVGALLSTLNYHCYPPCIPKHYRLAYRMLLGFVNYAFGDAFDLLRGAHVMLRMETIFVAPAYRGLGIAGRLVDLAIELAKHIRTPYIITLCTPIKSQNLCYKKGFTDLKVIDYLSYQELDGSFPFAHLAVDEPTAKLMIKNIL